jgi:hypothetical protein
MGGSGSGRSQGKYAVEDCFDLSISELARRGFHTEPDWRRFKHWPAGWDEPPFILFYWFDEADNGMRLLLDEPHQYIKLNCTYPHLGGQRWWFNCPSCDRRCSKLYLPPRDRIFLCRICHDLTYRSCQQSHSADIAFALIAAQNGCSIKDARRAVAKRLEGENKIDLLIKKLNNAKRK